MQFSKTGGSGGKSLFYLKNFYKKKAAIIQYHLIINKKPSLGLEMAFTVII